MVKEVSIPLAAQGSCKGTLNHHSVIDTLKIFSASLDQAEKELTSVKACLSRHMHSGKEVEALKRVKEELMHRVQCLENVAAICERGLNLVERARLNRDGNNLSKEAAEVVMGGIYNDGNKRNENGSNGRRSMQIMDNSRMRSDLDSLERVCEGFMADMVIDDRMKTVVDNVMGRFQNEECLSQEHREVADFDKSNINTRNASSNT